MTATARIDRRICSPCLSCIDTITKSNFPALSLLLSLLFGSYHDYLTSN